MIRGRRPHPGGLPLLRDVDVAERPDLLASKLTLCSVLHEFNEREYNPSAVAEKDAGSATSKEEKRQLLLELVDFVNVKKSIPPNMYRKVVDMVKANILRPLPPGRRDFEPNFDEDEEDASLEPAWPHLQLIYEFLLRFIVSGDTDPKVAKKYIDKDMIVQMILLINSEDPRERDYLKTILHRVYGKFMSHRPFIRRAINNAFYRFIYETPPVHDTGISELLEILGSIINGFALPLKEEHKTFLVKALIPLHKPAKISSYQQQLSYCVTQFAEKDPLLVEEIIMGLLHFWPAQNSGKIMLFLAEVEELLELAQAAQFDAVCTPLFRLLADCVKSPHAVVAERSLFLWNNGSIHAHILRCRETILPLVFGALVHNTRGEDGNGGHWSSNVEMLSFNVQKLFMEMDSELYDSVAEDYEHSLSAQEVKMAAETQWEAIEAEIGGSS